MRPFFTLTLLLFSAASALAQSSSVQATLIDGSVVRSTLIDQDLTVATKYGELKIPLSEVVSIQFGFRPTTEELKAAKQLDSDVFLVRQKARLHLASARRNITPLLSEAAQSSDPEKRDAAEQLILQQRERDPNTDSIRSDDLIKTAAGFSLVGKISATSIKLQTASLGSFEPTLDRFTRLRVTHHNAKRIEVIAARHGPRPTDWLDAGVYLEKGDRVTITASGQVDLYPPSPGQYVSGPVGTSYVHEESKSSAGSLLAKIGDGAQIRVGENVTITAASAGDLALRIAPSTWTSTPTGKYDVTIQVAP